MEKYQYFSPQVFHIAENYLEAAERCLEGRPEEGSEALNALLWPSEHCAIIACELFLKSLIAQTEKPEPGVIYTPTYETKFPIQKKNKQEIGTTHISPDLINYIKTTQAGQSVWGALGEQDQCFLLENTYRFAGTRYPFERNDIRPDKTHLKIAKKLQMLIRELIKADDNGNIILEMNIITRHKKQSNSETPNI